MDIQEKLEAHRTQVRELSQEIQNLRTALSEAVETRDQLCREQESLLMAMLEDDDYRCPMCEDNNDPGIMELKTHHDHFNAITYTLECPKCGLTTPVDCNKLSILLRWYKFINKIKGKNNE